MRAMRNGAMHLRNHTSLVVRGSSPHIFRGLGLFAEAGLLFCGTYLLGEALLQPLDAGPVSVIGGGLFLALATVLFFYLAWPSYKKLSSRRDEQWESLEVELPAEYEIPEQAHRDGRWALEKEEELPGPM